MDIKKKGIGIFIAAILVIATFAAMPFPASAATEAEIDQAIDNGLAYLAANQNADGSWGTSYPVAETAFAVMAFECEGHFPTGDPATDPYVLNVRDGLDYILANAHVTAISVQTAGDPDTNGNGIGIYFNSPGTARYTYETGIVMLAITGSNAPDRVATTGPANVNGRTYREILTDVVDWCAWAQTDSGSNQRGGWDYGPQDNSSTRSDNSISQWPVLGLWMLENPYCGPWNISAPDWVKSELELWLNYTQHSGGTDDGGFGYTGPDIWVNIAKTGAGLSMLNYSGVSSTDLRVFAAINYTDRHWNDATDGSGDIMNFGNYYAMYAVMKGCEINGITYIDGHDWYDEYADWLVGNQSADGSWTAYGQWGTPILKTDWALLILEQCVCPGAPPEPAAVPTLTPIGLIALIGLLSVIAAISISTTIRKKGQ